MRTRLHKQARKNTCAVASLRTVLDVQLGVKVAEAALEAHATSVTEPIIKLGTSTTQLRAMLKGVNRTHNAARPWRLRVCAIGTIDALERELAAGRVPMCALYLPNDDCDYHMVVVLAVSETHVKVFDPDPSVPSMPQWVLIPAFLDEWTGDGRSSWYAVVNAD